MPLFRVFVPENNNRESRRRILLCVLSALLLLGFWLSSRFDHLPWVFNVSRPKATPSMPMAAAVPSLPWKTPWHMTAWRGEGVQSYIFPSYQTLIRGRMNHEDSIVFENIDSGSNPSSAICSQCDPRKQCLFPESWLSIISENLWLQGSLIGQLWELMKHIESTWYLPNKY